MSNYKYVLFSEIDKYSTVISICTNEIVFIQNKNKKSEVCAYEVNVGDSIYIPSIQRTLHNIKYIGYSNYLPTCIASSGIVQLPYGESKYVSELEIGDQVITGNMNIARVWCILRQKIVADDPSFQLWTYNGLTLTGYHPILWKGKWQFPSQIPEFIATNITDGEYIYSIAIDSADVSIRINDIEVITLGHGIQNDPVATHPFFGTHKIFDVLFKLAPDGYCTIDSSYSIIRDKATGLICDIVCNSHDDVI